MKPAFLSYQSGFSLSLQSTHSPLLILTFRPLSSSKSPAVNPHAHLSPWCAKVSPGIDGTTSTTAVPVQTPSESIGPIPITPNPKIRFALLV